MEQVAQSGSGHVSDLRVSTIQKSYCIAYMHRSYCFDVCLLFFRDLCYLFLLHLHIDSCMISMLCLSVAVRLPRWAARAISAECCFCCGVAVPISFFMVAVVCE